MTILRIYDLYEYDRSSYCAPATLKKYKEDIQLFFRFLNVKYHICVDQDGFAALPEDADIYKDYIVHLRGTVKNSTIRSYCRSVKAFLRYCYEEDLCKDYLKRVKLPKDDAAPKLPLYMDEVKSIDATFDKTTEKGIRNYCIVHLMLDCGLRCQEVVHLKPEHIDQERNILTIMDSKGNKSRFVLIPDFVLEAIAVYRSMRILRTEFLFQSLKKTVPLTNNTIKLLFQDLKQETGIDRLHAHLLRHTFATSYLMGGGNLEFLRVFLGHYDYSVTKVYSSMAAQFKMLGADIYQLDPIFFTRGY